MTGKQVPPAFIPQDLQARENATLLTNILRGIEKECLRTAPKGQLAMTPHPLALGSAFTHPSITTDFSEALLEFISSPTHSMSAMMEQLRAVHQFTYQNIGDELLWVNSMPCMVGLPEEIPIAQYGSSNRGKMKSVYRVGLGHRYGRAMQTVAGVHYNFSLPRSFWAFLHAQENSVVGLSTYITKKYFDLVRNFRRHYWLLIYLFGASPAMCRSFVKGRKHNLEAFGRDDHTLHLPYATSLRMGDLGYQSSAQESLRVCYNNRAQYVNTLSRAISTPYAAYQSIGLNDADGDFKQLNNNLLQIENEFYSPIRPKRTANKGETALMALCSRGVEYIEVRCLDLDPWSPLGVNEEQTRFLDTFLVYCALAESPETSFEESEYILVNQKRVVNEGRRPDLKLLDSSGTEVGMYEWGMQLMDALHDVAKLLDNAHQSESYIESWAAQKEKLTNSALTPSARVLTELQEGKLTFARWALKRAKENKMLFLDQEFDPALEKKYRDLADESLQLQAAEDDQPQEPFEDYLESYYQQYANCCGEYPC